MFQLKRPAWTGADSNTDILVGDLGSANSIFSGFDVDSQVTVDVRQFYSSANTISITVNQGGASAGAAKVTIWYSGTLA